MSRLSAGSLLLLMTAAPASAQEFLGKTMSVWTKELDRPDEAARRNAAFALGKFGKKGLAAVPALTKHLKGDTSAKVREAAAVALGEVGKENGGADLQAPLVQALKDENYLVRRSAAFALGSLGLEAESVRDALSAALKDARPEVRQNVAWALGKIGVTGVPEIRKALHDADSLVKRDAAAALAGFEPQIIRPALNDLLPLCKEKDSEVRKAALIVLVKIVEPKDTAALAPIRQALKDKDAEVRANAALALSNIGGKDAADAVPILLEALRRGDIDLRRQAAAALRNIGPDAKAAVPELIKILRDPDEEIRTNAALALGGIGVNAQAAVPALVAVIADGQEKTNPRVEAATALSRIGSCPAAVQAVPTLLQILENPGQDPKVRERVVWSLRAHKIELRNLPGVFPTLTKILSEPRTEINRMLRYDCAYMLGVLQGADVPPVVMSVLLEFLKDEAIQVFEDKKSTVGGTGQETNSGKADVKEVGRGDGRVMAVQALGQVGPVRIAQHREIVQQLQALANNPATFPDLREKAAALLKTLK